MLRRLAERDANPLALEKVRPQFLDTVEVHNPPTALTRKNVQAGTRSLPQDGGLENGREEQVAVGLLEAALPCNRTLAARRRPAPRGVDARCPTLESDWNSWKSLRPAERFRQFILCTILVTTCLPECFVQFNCLVSRNSQQRLALSSRLQQHLSWTSALSHPVVLRGPSNRLQEAAPRTSRPRTAR